MLSPPARDFQSKSHVRHLSDLVVNTKAFGRAKRIVHVCGTILANLIVAPIEEEDTVYGSQIDLLRN